MLSTVYLDIHNLIQTKGVTWSILFFGICPLKVSPKKYAWKWFTMTIRCYFVLLVHIFCFSSDEYRLIHITGDGRTRCGLDLWHLPQQSAQVPMSPMRTKNMLPGVLHGAQEEIQLLRSQRRGGVLSTQRIRCFRVSARLQTAWGNRQAKYYARENVDAGNRESFCSCDLQSVSIVTFPRFDWVLCSIFLFEGPCLGFSSVLR